jgi:FAD/FMN-containing dehydrogenase/Fe-S oxidoreductase
MYHHDQKKPRNDLPPEAVAAFAAGVRGEVWADALARAMYSTDASIFQIRPAAVVVPRDSADVSAAVKLAGRFGMTLAARGAASGLAGECLTPGIALDLSRHCTAIGQIDEHARTATVEAGCVLATLNEELAPRRLLFGPDPASANRATIGGVIGNNSTGAHSMRYGHASDNLRWLDVVLADGTAARFHADGRIESAEPSALREQIAQHVPALLAQWRQRIEARWPATDRNRAGYDVRRAQSADGTINWCRLLAGSEGTLAVFTQACLLLQPLPPVKALVQLNYVSLAAMAAALPHLVATGPAACELMDQRVLAMARQAHGGPHPHLPDVPASLLVEHAGEDLKAVEAGLDRTLAAAAAAGGLAAPPVKIADPAQQAELWAIRKSAEPLLFRGRNAPQPVPFIEDVAVPVGRMSDYLGGLEQLFTDERVTVSYYAHAGHGELHIRPFLDLHTPFDRQKMVRIAQHTFELAWQCGGSISGEHGCGRIRSGWLASQYGELYELFRQIKTAFDPDGHFNEGNLITDQSPQTLMTTQLRFDHVAQPRVAEDVALAFCPGELIGELEACNGCGECMGREARLRMCPVFRVLGSEKSSPRGMANAMRQVVTGLVDSAVRQDGRLAEMADLCIHCRSCQFECPSAVNIPKLMREVHAVDARLRGIDRPSAILARAEAASRMGCDFALLSNLAARLPGARWLLEKLTGIDRRRKLPAFERFTFSEKAAGTTFRRGALGPSAEKVCYFLDVFADCHDHALAQAAIDVLTHNGLEVYIPPQRWAAMPAIARGDLGDAREAIEANLPALAEAVRKGHHIICSEPAAAGALRHEWPAIVPGSQADAVARGTLELTQFLFALHQAGRLKTDFRPLDLHLAYHAPCHLRALRAGLPGLALVRLIPGVRVETLPNACCGLAGTYGLQKRHYELSLAMGRPMLEALAASEASGGLTECSACRMQMEHASGKSVLHPIKLMAAAYGYGVPGLERV